jgi:MSHA pilin protein MshA
MRKQQGGFTLIELVMVIVILGILAASFAPKFVDLGTGAEAAAKAGASGAVKAALTVYIAEKKVEPTVSQLAGYVTGKGVSTASGSITMPYTKTDGTSGTITVPTYPSSDCTGTANSTDVTVKCVGDAT